MTKDLKLLLKKFPDKSSINFYDAKEFISESITTSIDIINNVINIFLFHIKIINTQIKVYNYLYFIYIGLIELAKGNTFNSNKEMLVLLRVV